MLGRKSLLVYRAAIVEKFTELEVRSIKYLAEGWESVACVVNDELIFRFPKTAGASRYLGVEIRLLPRLVPFLPLPVPQFEYVATNPSDGYPYSFVGYPMLRGDFLEDRLAEVEGAQWWKQKLGDFLTVLHSFPVTEARSLGVTPIDLVAKLTGRPPKPDQGWRAALSEYYELGREKAYPLLSEVSQNNITARFDHFLDDPANFEFEPVLLHADFSYDHVLIDAEGQKVTGVIDFGDVGIGDPALDFMWEADALPYYRGRIDPALDYRRQFYRQILELHMLVYGQLHDDPDLVAEGVAAVEEFFSAKETQDER